MIIEQKFGQTNIVLKYLIFSKFIKNVVYNSFPVSYGLIIFRYMMFLRSYKVKRKIDSRYIMQLEQVSPVLSHSVPAASIFWSNRF